jgi:integrase
MLTLAWACEHRETRKVVRIAFYSGMRLSEMLSLGPSEGVFELHDTKNGESRNVPIHPKIACLAKNLPIKLKRGNWSAWSMFTCTTSGTQQRPTWSIQASICSPWGRYWDTRICALPSGTVI